MYEIIYNNLYNLFDFSAYKKDKKHMIYDIIRK